MELPALLTNLRPIEPNQPEVFRGTFNLGVGGLRLRLGSLLLFLVFYIHAKTNFSLR